LNIEHKKIKATHIINAAKKEEIDLDVTISNQVVAISPLSVIHQHSLIEINKNIFLDMFSELKTDEAEHYILRNFDKQLAERILSVLTVEQKKRDLNTNTVINNFLLEILPIVMNGYRSVISIRCSQSTQVKVQKKICSCSVWVSFTAIDQRYKSREN
jgi:hypothetical protein